MRTLLYMSLLLLMACQKTDPIVNLHLPSYMLLREVATNVYDGEEAGTFVVSESFVFNDQDQLEEMSKVDGEDMIRWSFQYDGSTPYQMHIYRNDLWVQKTTFIWKEDRMIGAQTHSMLTDVLLFEDHFIYDRSGVMIRHERASPFGVDIKNFSWFEGNIQVIESNFAGAAFQYNYEYDMMINPYRVVFRDFGFDIMHQLPLSLNNQTHESIVRSFDGADFGTHDIQYSYQLPGYPYYASIIMKDHLKHAQRITKRFRYRAISP